MSFSGLIPAVLTPFTPDDQVDVEALRDNVAHLAEGGCARVRGHRHDGRGGSLSFDERRLVIETVVAAAGDRPVLSGVSAASTAAACANAELARAAGCAGVMSTPPVNYPGTLAELIAFYAAVADAAGRPVMLYNNPQAAGVDLEPERIARIAEAVPAITCVKECSGEWRGGSRDPRALGPRRAGGR